MAVSQEGGMHKMDDRLAVFEKEGNRPWIAHY